MSINSLKPLSMVIPTAEQLSILKESRYRVIDHPLLDKCVYYYSYEYNSNREINEIVWKDRESVWIDLVILPVTWWPWEDA